MRIEILEVIEDTDADNLKNGGYRRATYVKLASGDWGLLDAALYDKEKDVETFISDDLDIDVVTKHTSDRSNVQ